MIYKLILTCPPKQTDVGSKYEGIHGLKLKAIKEDIRPNMRLKII